MICNLGVVGSNPTRGSKKSKRAFLFKKNGQLPEWPNGADCNSADLRLRWFESITAHLLKNKDAEIAQLIEH